MRTGFSSNVVLAKVRAMYGKSITTEDYKNLLNCNCVSEIASYLKSKTAYSSVLDTINESDIHRGQLENLLKNKMFNDWATICRYEISTGENFAEFIIHRAEVEQIVHGLVHLSVIKTSKTPCDFYIIPPYFSKHTKINFEAMSRAKNYEEFLESLYNSHYKKLLHDLTLRDDGSVNLSEAEKVLYDDLYGRFFFNLEKHQSKPVKENLKSTFRTYIDFSNFVRIIRAKRNLCLGTFAVLDNGSLKKKYIDAMLCAASEKEAFSIMESTSPGRKLKSINYKYIDQIPLIALHSKCKNDLHMSLDASVVMFSYMFLIQTELNNIIKIIEGVRYKLPKEEIKSLLIAK